jgi:hypothetical protein
MIERPAPTAALATLVLALTAITPVCGLLFDCGCTWPWAGLARGCNYFDPASPIHCPWCDTLALGLAATILTSASGIAGSLLPELLTGRLNRQSLLEPRRASSMTARIGETTLRLAVGGVAFFLAALGAGWATIALTGYPKFLF